MWYRRTAPGGEHMFILMSDINNPLAFVSDTRIYSGGYVHLNTYIRLALYDLDSLCLLDVISPQVEVEVLLAGSFFRRRPRMNTHAAATLKGTPA
jgi:hypothetical protein